MISFNYEIDFKLNNTTKISNWITNVILSEGFKEGEINYIFCDDDYLHKLNLEFLKHDTLTDIISFDYSLGKEIHGDIFISIDRVKENATLFATTFQEEIYRVLIHGVLHYLGYKDKDLKDKEVMRFKENEALSLLNI